MKLRKTIRRHRGLIGVALLLSAAGTVWAVTRAAAPPEGAVIHQTAQVSRDAISVTISGTGNLEFYEPEEVWPSDAGEVASVEVEEGEEVSAGDTLYTMDSASADAAAERGLVAYRQAQESVARAEAALVRARSLLAELKERRKQQQAVAKSSQPATQAAAAELTQAVTDSDIAAAETDAATAEAGLATAKASRASAKRSYDEAVAAKDDLVVTAPVAGVVWSIAIEEGDSISGGSSSAGASTAGAAATAGNAASTASAGSQAPVTLVRQGALALKLAVNEVDVPALEAGQRALVEIDALPGVTLAGAVHEIARTGSVSNGVVTFDVWITFDSTNEALRPGMSAAVEIVTAAAEDSLLVPNAAVETDGLGYHVLVLDSPDTAPRRVAIEPGLANNTHTQVLSGLAEGDTVVTGTVETEDADAGGMLLLPPSGGPGGGGPGGMPNGAGGTDGSR